MTVEGIPVLYEDNHLLVVVKPPGLPVQSDRSGDPDLLTLLKEGVKRRHGKPGNVFLGMVHRLDRPVGGVMVFARTSKGASRLSAQIRARTFEKTYEALVQGCPDPSTGRLVHHLVKDQFRNVVRVVPAGTPGAREAILDYEVIRKEKTFSRVRIQLRTGRPHQIRVQLAAIGCPLVGDHKYGSPSAAHDGPALWSTALRFMHPTRNEAMQFEAPPPWSASG